MTEAEWLGCTEPQKMLELLSKGTSRKPRLFGCACVRWIWHLLQDERSRAAVEIGERYADRLISAEEVNTAWEAADEAARPIPSAGAEEAPMPWAEAEETATAYAAAVTIALWAPARWGATEAARWVAQCGLVQPGEVNNAQASILRDLFGNPYRPVSLDPAWRTPDVLSLAQAAYDNRTLPAGTLEPERLGLLADALEESGCANADLLGHLRGEGVHVRGCWVVDLVLDK